jgi:urease subunit gamma/beta
MRLTPAERDRLQLFTAAQLARARLARGLQLNVPEATAMVADAIAEAARDGARLREAVEAGRRALRADQVLPEVIDIVREVRVEATFDDGTRLAVVHDPFGGLPVAGSGRLAPGAVLPVAATRPTVPDGAEVVHLTVTNTAEVPISVTSHYHFFEANPRLRFDRAAAYGRRLAVASGDVVRFDPGSEVPVGLVPLEGERVVVGFAGLVDGPLDAPGAREAALARARACGYLGADVAGEGAPA